MPDRYWCTSCDVGYTDVVPGNCPHCGSPLVDMEGFMEDVEPSEYQDYEDDEEVQSAIDNDLTINRKTA